MTQNILLILQFLISFFGVILTIIKIIDLLRFKHIERLDERIDELEQRMKNYEKE